MRTEYRDKGQAPEFEPVCRPVNTFLESIKPLRRGLLYASLYALISTNVIIGYFGTKDALNKGVNKAHIEKILSEASEKNVGHKILFTAIAPGRHLAYLIHGEE